MCRTTPANTDLFVTKRHTATRQAYAFSACHLSLATIFGLVKRMEEQEDNNEVRAMEMFESHDQWAFKDIAVSFQLKLIFNLRLTVCSSIFSIQCSIQFLDGWKPLRWVNSWRLRLLEIHMSCIPWCQNGETQNGMPFSGSPALKSSPAPFGRASGAAAGSQLRRRCRCHCSTASRASHASGGPSRTGDPQGLWQLLGRGGCHADKAPGWWSSAVCPGIHPKRSQLLSPDCCSTAKAPGWWSAAIWAAARPGLWHLPCPDCWNTEKASGWWSPAIFPVIRPKLCHLPSPDCCYPAKAPGWWSSATWPVIHPKLSHLLCPDCFLAEQASGWSIAAVPGSTPKMSSPHWNQEDQVVEGKAPKTEMRHIQCYLWRPRSAWQCTASTVRWFSSSHLQLIHCHLQLIHCLFQPAARPRTVEDWWSFRHLGPFELLPNSTFRSLPLNVPTVSCQMPWRMMCAATDAMLRRNHRKGQIALRLKLSRPLRETNLQAVKRSNHAGAMPCWFDKLALQCWRPLWNLESPPGMTPPEPPCLEAGPPEASPTGGKVLLARKEVLGLCGRIPVCFLLLWCLLAVASLRRVSANMPFRVGLCRFHCTPRQCEKTPKNCNGTSCERSASAPSIESLRLSKPSPTNGTKNDILKRISAAWYCALKSDARSASACTTSHKSPHVRQRS